MGIEGPAHEASEVLQSARTAMFFLPVLRRQEHRPQAQLTNLMNLHDNQTKLETMFSNVMDLKETFNTKDKCMQMQQ